MFLLCSPSFPTTLRSFARSSYPMRPAPVRSLPRTSLSKPPATSDWTGPKWGDIASCVNRVPKSARANARSAKLHHISQLASEAIAVRTLAQPDTHAKLNTRNPSTGPLLGHQHANGLSAKAGSIHPGALRLPQAPKPPAGLTQNPWPPRNQAETRAQAPRLRTRNSNSTRGANHAACEMAAEYKCL